MSGDGKAGRYIQDDESQDTYRVGYGKPPKEHRFKAGEKSPNAAGRPRGSGKASKNRAGEASLDDLILEALGRPARIRKEGKLLKVPMIEAIADGLVIKAAQGDARARKEVLARAEVAQRKREVQMEELRVVAMELRDLWTALGDRHRLGYPGWGVYPERDDISIDPETGRPIWSSMWLTLIAAAYKKMKNGESPERHLGVARRGYDLEAVQRTFDHALKRSDLALAISMLRQAVEDTNKAIEDQTPQERREALVELLSAAKSVPLGVNRGLLKRPSREWKLVDVDKE